MSTIDSGAVNENFKNGHNDFFSDEDLGITTEHEVDDVQSLNSLVNDFASPKLMILNVNIRSLNKNLDNLKVFIERLSLKPHVIVCSETFNLQCMELLQLDNYDMHYNSSQINKNDGVIIYVKSDLIYNVTHEQIENLKIVSCLIKSKDNSTVKISGIYRCHDFDKTTFIDNFKMFISNNKHIKNHFIAGDFNLDIMSTDDMNQTHLFNFLQAQYLPLFTKITRPNENNVQTGSCIDNILSRSNYTVLSYKINNVFNDHYPLFAIIDIKHNIKVSDESSPNSFISNKKLTVLASKQSWNKILDSKDPELALNEFISTLKTLLIKSTVTIRKKNKSRDKRKNWITNGIITSCNKKELLYQIWRKNPLNETYKNDYKNYVKLLNKVIKAAKVKFEEEIVNKCNNDCKRLWSYIKNKLGKNTKKSNKIDCIIDNGETLEDPKRIANSFNNFFGSIGKKLAEQLISDDSEDLKLPIFHEKSIFLNPVNNCEVLQIINSLKDKAGGIDGLNAKFLKVISVCISLPLTHILNLCIQNSVWPDALKEAEVVPIYKTGDKKLATNYRPISLISNIAKIFEKLIHNRLYSFFFNNNILSSNQFGFKKNVGTKDALSHAINTIVENIDKNKKVIGTFLDLSKAFDTVKHCILLEKLNRYGIRGTALEFMKSYLTNRKQKVKIQGQYSNEILLEVGVPQGTILGPLLFIIYINDLLNVLPDNAISSYADDTIVISLGETWEETQLSMNLYLKKVSEWLISNQLSLNIAKTVFIAFGLQSDSVPNTLDIRINDKQIQRVEFCKYLGVLFDSNLRWNVHINHIVRKTKYLIYLFSKLSNFMNARTLYMIYYAFFHSIGTYGIIAWGGAYGNSLCGVQSVQKRILKIIAIKSKVSKNIICKTPPSIKQCFLLESVVNNYSSLSNEYRQSNSITRNKIVLPKVNKTKTLKSSLIIPYKIFNALPVHLKSLVSSTHNIKSQLKVWINTNTSKLLNLNLLTQNDLL